MAIIRKRFPMPLLLFVLLWLALDPSEAEAGRVPSDRVVFPTERGSDATETGPKPWDLGPVMNLKEIRNETKSSQVQSGNELNSRAGLPVVEPARNDNKSAKIPVSKNPTEETTPVSKNATVSMSEDKMIAFGSDTKIDGNRTVLTMAPKGSVLIGPRITLESVRICPEGFTLSNDHCRKSA